LQNGICVDLAVSLVHYPICKLVGCAFDPDAAVVVLVVLVVAVVAAVVAAVVVSNVVDY